MLGIVDYGVGNLFSLQSSLNKVGQKTVVTGDGETLMGCDRIILPGVGAFSDAAAKLYSTEMAQVLTEYIRTGKPLLGVCLGMQLLFTKSFEYGEHRGLNFITGEVRPISDVTGDGLKVPHMGWNALEFAVEHPLFKYIKAGDCVYFVHSYAAFDCDRDVIARTEYGGMLTAAVGRDNIMGCQFHPEKSGNVGLKVLQAFCEMGVKGAC